MNRLQILNILEQKVLPLVQKPGRYIGGEVNSVIKDPRKISVHVALAFPDVYELGMSNLGLKILYEIVNNESEYFAERVFAPWPDLEKYLREYKIPLFSLESHSSVSAFDILGFSLQYELGYTNILNLLDLAGIPLYTKDRFSWDWPLVIAGGPVAVTPEPMAPFIDAFLIGDGEEAILEIVRMYEQHKGKKDKRELLLSLAENISGIYVPSLYQAGADQKGRLTKFVPENEKIPLPVSKRVIADLDSVPMCKKPIVPLIDIVHNRATIEIMRGCPRNCHFCQARAIYQPFRKRSLQVLKENAREVINNTGCQEISLSGLSTTDYQDIEILTSDLLKERTERKISISLPSMRIDSFSLDLINKISQVKKTGITLAPEAASDKLLQVLNKGYRSEDFIKVVRQAFGLGYNLIKLYFMIGLPEEEMADLDKMVDIIYRIRRLGKEIRGNSTQLHVAIATLIPKPHTPFQLCDMTSLADIKKKQEYLFTRLKQKNIKISFHAARQSLLESVFTRGDRNLASVIAAAWRLGCKFDQWQEHFRYDLWLQAFKESNVSIDNYLFGWDNDDAVPWGHIDVGHKNVAE